MNPEPLEVQVGKLLTARNLTLALAESCTGGLISHRLTEVPGSSTYFLGGIVAYAYDVKERQLGVKHNTLYDHGAVSAETALEMARGARRALGTDIGLGVTGIAGPGGGMPGKPVGLVHLAVARRGGGLIHEKQLFGDQSRRQIRLLTVQRTFALVGKVL